MRDTIELRLLQMQSRRQGASEPKSESLLMRESPNGGSKDRLKALAAAAARAAGCKVTTYFAEDAAALAVNPTGGKAVRHHCKFL